MAGKQFGRWGALAILACLLLAPATTFAGPYFGDWTWLWHPAPDDTRVEYSPLHYWVPGYFDVRAYVHPSNLDQYPPGPSPSVPPSYIFNKTRCRSIPPAPSAPYADPDSYYGRPIAP